MSAHLPASRNSLHGFASTGRWARVGFVLPGACRISSDSSEPIRQEFGVSASGVQVLDVLLTHRGARTAGYIDATCANRCSGQRGGDRDVWQQPRLTVCAQPVQDINHGARDAHHRDARSTGCIDCGSSRRTGGGMIPVRCGEGRRSRGIIVCCAQREFSHSLGSTQCSRAAPGFGGVARCHLGRCGTDRQHNSTRRTATRSRGRRGKLFNPLGERRRCCRNVVRVHAGSLGVHATSEEHEVIPCVK